jgi:hypothetical protein
MSWEATLNESYSKKFDSTKMVTKNINILHECTKSRDANRILTTSIKSELSENDNEASTTSPFYLEDVENMIHKKIDEIHNKKKKPKQLEIKYLLYKININAYITKITKKLELMENKKRKKKMKHMT